MKSVKFVGKLNTGGEKIHQQKAHQSTFWGFLSNLYFFFAFWPLVFGKCQFLNPDKLMGFHTKKTASKAYYGQKNDPSPGQRPATHKVKS